MCQVDKFINVVYCGEIKRDNSKYCYQSNVVTSENTFGDNLAVQIVNQQLVTPQIDVLILHKLDEVQVNEILKDIDDCESLLNNMKDTFQTIHIKLYYLLMVYEVKYEDRSWNSTAGYSF